MQAAMACPCPHGRAERPATDPRNPSRAALAHSVDRRSAAESYYANCDSTDAPAERCAHPGTLPAHSTPGSARPSSAGHQPPPGAQRHRSPPPQHAPHHNIRRSRVMSPRPTKRLPKDPHLQAFCDAGGGTRTPDTRIMIVIEGLRSFAAALRFGSKKVFQNELRRRQQRMLQASVRNAVCMSGSRS